MRKRGGAQSIPETGLRVCALSRREWGGCPVPPRSGIRVALANAGALCYHSRQAYGEGSGVSGDCLKQVSRQARKSQVPSPL